MGFQHDVSCLWNQGSIYPIDHSWSPRLLLQLLVDLTIFSWSLAWGQWWKGTPEEEPFSTSVSNNLSCSGTGRDYEISCVFCYCHVHKQPYALETRVQWQWLCYLWKLLMSSICLAICSTNSRHKLKCGFLSQGLVGLLLWAMFWHWEVDVSG